MIKKLLALVALLALPLGEAAAQIGPGTNGPFYSGNFYQGFVPTAQFWNLLESNKIDYNPSGLAVLFGGTGATNAAQARANLGIPNVPGTVTSVGVTVPSALLTATGSPVTGAGTIAITLPTQTANKIFAGPTTGAAATPTFRSLVEADLPGTFANSVSNVDGTLTISPITGSVVASLALGHANTWSGQQTFVAPVLGTPTSVTLTNATGLPNSGLVNPATTVNGQTCTLGSTCTVTAAASSLIVGTTAVASGTTGRILYDAAGVLGEMTTSGSGTVVALTDGPTFVAPLLGTPASGVATNLTGLPLTTGVTGLLGSTNGGSGVNNAGTLTWGAGGTLGTNAYTSTTYVPLNGAGGTPTSLTLTNATGLPISTGVSGLGTGVATFLVTPSATNLNSMLTGGTLLYSGGALGTPSSGVATNLTGVTLAGHAAQAANTVVGNGTSGSASPTALAVPSCSSASNALTWTSGTGFGCNTIAGSGTVNSGTINQLAYYAATGTAVSTTSAIPNGITATTQAAADNSTKVATTAYADRTGVQQVVSTLSSAVATGTTLMPFDDTIPQNTEGDQYMSLAITPKSATSKLKITVVGNFGFGSADAITMALFQDSTANALAAVPVFSVSNTMFQGVLVWEMTSGTTSATTFKVRAGSNGGGTLTFNGRGAARLMGGVMASSVTIEEIGF